MLGKSVAPGSDMEPLLDPPQEKLVPGCKRCNLHLQQLLLDLNPIFRLRNLLRLLIESWLIWWTVLHFFIQSRTCTPLSLHCFLFCFFSCRHFELSFFSGSPLLHIALCKIGFCCRVAVCLTTLQHLWHHLKFSIKTSSHLSPFSCHFSRLVHHLPAILRPAGTINLQ